jgi:imidazolonepropionase-like amidohydrolase
MDEMRVYGSGNRGYHDGMRFVLCLVLAGGLAAQPVTLTGVNVVDVVEGKIRAGQTVVLNGERIAEIGPGVKPVGAVVEAAGYYLMPGLWDMHVHFRNNPVDRERVLEEENAALLELFLVNGVVGVREMGGDLSDQVLRWREEIRSGKRVGPRILTPGRKLDQQRAAWPGSITTVTPEEGREAVRQMKRAGADFIKVYYNEAEAEVLKAVIEEAHAAGLKVTGHLPANLTLAAVHEMGLDGIEHGMYLRAVKQADHERMEAERKGRVKAELAMDVAESTRRSLWTHDAEEAKRLYALLARSGFWVTPTLVVEARVRYEIAERDFTGDPRKRYFFPAIWESWDVKGGTRRAPAQGVLELMKRAARQRREWVLEAHKAGVPLLAGTDCGVSNNYVLPGWSMHEELAAMVEMGLTPAEALRTATVNAAKWRGEEASEGTVEKGKRADLVLLRANPLTAIGAAREVEAVFLGGRHYPRRQLDAMLRAVERRAAAGKREGN